MLLVRCRLAVTSCQLGNVPSEALAKAKHTTVALVVNCWKKEAIASRLEAIAGRRRTTDFGLLGDSVPGAERFPGK